MAIGHRKYNIIGYEDNLLRESLNMNHIKLYSHVQKQFFFTSNNKELGLALR